MALLDLINKIKGVNIILKTANRSTKDTEFITVSTDRLAELLDCGKSTARIIGKKLMLRLRLDVGLSGM